MKRKKPIISISLNEDIIKMIRDKASIEDTSISLVIENLILKAIKKDDINDKLKNIEDKLDKALKLTVSSKGNIEKNIQNELFNQSQNQDENITSNDTKLKESQFKQENKVDDKTKIKDISKEIVKLLINYSSQVKTDYNNSKRQFAFIYDRSRSIIRKLDKSKNFNEILQYLIENYDIKSNPDKFKEEVLSIFNRYNLVLIS